MKKTPRFVKSFMDDYIGENSEEYVQNLRNLLVEATGFLKDLNEDILFAETICNKIDSESARRVFLRAMPAYVEGSLNFLRVAPFGLPPLTAKIPERYVVNFSEAMLEFRNKTSVKDSIKNTLLGFSHITDVNLSNTLMGEKGAQQLLESFRIRDDIMHPRSPSSFKVSLEQVRTAKEGLIWYQEKFNMVWAPLPGVARSLYPNKEAAE